MIEATRNAVVRMLAIAWILAMGEINLAFADEPKQPAPAVFELTVSTAAEPVPALKYHLLPPPEDMVRGNAAPIYLRVIWEQSPDWHRELRDESDRLIQFPLAELPLDDARTFIGRLDYALEQTSAASLRSECDWEYVLNEDPLSTRIPDAQSMRHLAKAIVIDARVAVRQGNAHGAIARLRTGMALGQNVAKAPLLICGLVGISLSNMMFGELDQIVALEGAPNLYWAISELPKPLISYDVGLGTDARMLRDVLPELAIPNAAIDWGSLALRLRDWAREVARSEQPDKSFAVNVTAESLIKARAALPAMTDFDAAAVAAMSDAEIEVRYMVAVYQVMFDKWAKWFRVPYPRALRELDGIGDRLKEEAERLELYPLVSSLIPASEAILKAQVKSARVVARQQVIEALRMHAAATGGLPQALDKVQVVPVPIDPASGKPFVYRLDGDTAVLDVEELHGMDREALRLPVQIRLRK